MYRSTGDANFALVGSPTATTFTDNNVVGGMDYFYEIVDVGANGAVSTAIGTEVTTSLGASNGTTPCGTPATAGVGSRCLVGAFAQHPGCSLPAEVGEGAVIQTFAAEQCADLSFLFTGIGFPEHLELIPHWIPATGGPDFRVRRIPWTRGASIAADLRF